MWTAAEKEDWIISQAKQQAKLRINEIGARAEVGTAIAMRSALAITPPLIIDEPFAVWFCREGCELPTAAFYVTPDDWKDPETLD